MATGNRPKNRASRNKRSALQRGAATVERAEHKAARVERTVDSAVSAAAVLTSGNPRRVLRWGVRKLAYKWFAKLVNKTVNRL
jgi:hypothetical protein